jgi:hypothetical protein
MFYCISCDEKWLRDDLTTRADFGRTRLVETAANVNPTALLSIFLVMMIAWYVPGGRAHIANAWQDLYYYAWRAWVEVRYPNWRESMTVRAIIALGVVGAVIMVASNETLRIAFQAGMMVFWLNKYARGGGLPDGAVERLGQELGRLLRFVVVGMVVVFLTVVSLFLMGFL